MRCEFCNERTEAVACVVTIFNVWAWVCGPHQERYAARDSEGNVIIHETRGESNKA